MKARKCLTCQMRASVSRRVLPALRRILLYVTANVAVVDAAGCIINPNRRHTIGTPTGGPWRNSATHFFEQRHLNLLPG